MSGTGGGHDLLFAHDFPPMGGGIARVMAAMVDRYPVGGIVVSTGTVAGAAPVLAGAAPVLAGAAPVPNVDRIAVPVDRLRTVWGLLAWSRRAVALARAPGARFAWCDTIRPAGYVAHWAFRRTRLPYGIMVVGNDVLTLRAKVRKSIVKRRIIRHVLGDAAAFAANSHWTAARLRELLDDLDLQAAASRIHVVPLGTDPARWRGDGGGGAEFRRRRALPEGKWIVTVARLVDYKGIDTAIRLVAGFVAEFTDLHYAVIGRGPDEARLRALAVELGVGERVHFLTDVSDEELSGAYSLADVYVGLTRETALDVEGFGISFAEAAGCGLPVVATRSGGIPDAVSDGDTGVLIGQDDIAGMEQALRGLLLDSAAARRMGAAGRARVERYLNWDRVVRELREIAAETGRT